jgi:O-succinylbenzoic acid--CoA ligase
MAQLADWPWQCWADSKQPYPALRLGDQNWSWQQLCERIDALAVGFYQQGLRPGDIVALRSKNSLTMLLAYLALLRVTARVLPLNPQLPVAVVSQLLVTLPVQWLIDLSDAPPLDNISHLVCQDLAGSLPPACCWQAQRQATLTLTSGSTGSPKAAVHALAAHQASAQGVLSLMPFQPGDSWLLSLPLFHVSGQGIVWRWLTAGATLVLTDEKLPWYQALQGCTHASLVPTQLWRLLTQRSLPATLREVLLGGAEIPLSLTQQAEDAGVHCYCGYGMTETASTVCAKRADGRPGVGNPLPGREVCIVDGELYIRASSLADGYWLNGQLLALTDEQGWFHSRDAGSLVQGEFVVAGRLDNLFFSGGEGIQPEAVERVLMQHPQVVRAFVLPIADREFGHRPVALLELHSSLQWHELSEWLADKLAGYQRPVAYYLLPTELAAGGIKIPRQRLQAWLEQQTAAESNS